MKLVVVYALFVTSTSFGLEDKNIQRRNDLLYPQLVPTENVRVNNVQSKERYLTPHIWAPRFPPMFPNNLDQTHRVIGWYPITGNQAISPEQTEPSALTYAPDYPLYSHMPPLYFQHPLYWYMQNSLRRPGYIPYYRPHPPQENPVIEDGNETITVTSGEGNGQENPEAEILSVEENSPSSPQTQNAETHENENQPEIGNTVTSDEKVEDEQNVLIDSNDTDKADDTDKYSEELNSEEDTVNILDSNADDSESENNYLPHNVLEEETDSNEVDDQESAEDETRNPVSSESICGNLNENRPDIDNTDTSDEERDNVRNIFLGRYDHSPVRKPYPVDRISEDKEESSLEDSDSNEVDDEDFKDETEMKRTGHNDKFAFIQIDPEYNRAEHGDRSLDSKVKLFFKNNDLINMLNAEEKKSPNQLKYESLLANGAQNTMSERSDLYNGNAKPTSGSDLHRILLTKYLTPLALKDHDVVMVTDDDGFTDAIAYATALAEAENRVSSKNFGAKNNMLQFDNTKNSNNVKSYLQTKRFLNDLEKHNDDMNELASTDFQLRNDKFIKSFKVVKDKQSASTDQKQQDFVDDLSLDQRDGNTKGIGPGLQSSLGSSKLVKSEVPLEGSGLFKAKDSALTANLGNEGLTVHANREGITSLLNSNLDSVLSTVKGLSSSTTTAGSKRVR